jgi:hypothetical protein
MPVTRPDKFIAEFLVDTLSKFIAPGILLLLTLAFGIWLSLSGKPYNGILFNIHKLIALAAVVVTAIQFYQMLKRTPLQMPPLAMIVIAGLCVLVLFFSGAMISAGKLDYQAMLTIHRAALILMLIMLAVPIYLFIGGKNAI